MTPTAREERSTFEEQNAYCYPSSRSFELQSTGHLLELGGAVACTARRQPSRPRSKHAATSRELLDLPESLSKSSQPRVLFGNADALAHCGEAGSHRGVAVTGEWS